MSTKTFNVNSAGYSQIIVGSVCKSVEVFEEDQAGTTDYYYSDSDVGSDDNKITKPAGTVLKLTTSTFFMPGRGVGWLKTQQGSVSFAQLEQS